MKLCPMHFCKLFLSIVVVIGLGSCKREIPSEDVETIFKAQTTVIKKSLIDAFWSASDKTLRENTALRGQSSNVEDFKKEHVCDVFSDEVIDGKRIVKFHITIPSIKGAFYEFTFEEVGDKWRSIDGRTRVGNQEFNYFEGRFLGKKSLKPYLDAELIKLGVPVVE